MDILKIKLRLSGLLLVLIISILVLIGVIYNSLQNIHKELLKSAQNQQKIIGIIEKYK